VEVWQASNLRRLRLGEEKKEEEQTTALTRVQIPNDISIGSTIFAKLTAD